MRLLPVAAELARRGMGLLAYSTSLCTAKIDELTCSTHMTNTVRRRADTSTSSLQRITDPEILERRYRTSRRPSITDDQL